MVHELLFLASKNLVIYLVPMTIITGMITMIIFNFLDNNHNMHVTEQHLDLQLQIICMMF